MDFRINLISISLMFMVSNSFAQNQVVKLWDEIPNSKQTSEEEQIYKADIIRVALVKEPILEIYLPPKRIASDKAVIICPGGGYRHLAYDWEGIEIAKWFNTKGISAFVLKSRLPLSKSLVVPYEAPLQDAQRAMRWVRFNADKFNISPDKIGVIGFSAGGHLASTLGTQFNAPNNFREQPLDTISAQPNFMVLVYPVITMQDDYTHKGSQKNLLGENASNDLKTRYSNELHVTQNTPPTFLIHSTDDKSVPVENSLKFYQALKNSDVKAEMHIYPYGGHGFGLAIGKGYLQDWTNRLEDWLLSI